MTWQPPAPQGSFDYRDGDALVTEFAYTLDQLLAVRREALEQAMQAAIDCVAFNGGTVQLESHIRQRIEAMKGLT